MRNIDDYLVQFALSVERADAAENRNDFFGSYPHWVKASRFNPGHGMPFTAISRITLRRRYGIPAIKARDAEPTGLVLIMSRLGLMGRFGNQILQYIGLRLIADVYNAEIETADWIGRDIFEIDDPVITLRLPLLNQSEFDFEEVLKGSDDRFRESCDMVGWFCHESSTISHKKDWIRSIFKYRDHLRRDLAMWRANLIPQGKKLIAIHLRKGDFGSDTHWIAPSQWYLTVLKEYNFEEYELYLATDDESSFHDFSDYRPSLASDITDWPSKLDFIFDFYMLQMADVVLTSNSTFSITAAMLNENAQTFMRPDRSVGALVEFNPWNTPILFP